MGFFTIGNGSVYPSSLWVLASLEPGRDRRLSHVAWRDGFSHVFRAQVKWLFKYPTLVFYLVSSG
jgi:hypothetical protein